MPPGCIPIEVFQACPIGTKPQGRPRTSCRDYISSLAWKHLRISQEEQEQGWGERYQQPVAIMVWTQIILCQVAQIILVLRVIIVVIAAANET